MIIIRASLRVKPGKEEEARAAFVDTMAGSQAEPGCAAYTFTADVADPGLIHVLEIWDSEAALQAHFTGEPFRNFLAVSGELIEPVSAAGWQGNLEPYELAFG